VNRLGASASPYLRQHRDNPVHWYEWCTEAFADAAQRDVPVLLSVGYSSCHWCHVMAHESFEDDEVAARMNERFVNVKVDREERPDVDALYMETVQRLTGRGGWPMTVALTPDGQPFFGGTYFPKAQFLQLLDAIDEAWRTKRAELATQASQITAAIRQSSALTAGKSLPTVESLQAALSSLATSFDREWGGFGAAPKFPQTMALELVLRAWATNGDEGARTVVTTTLDAMASGGIYDHLDGGFARYSTDRMWLVPHFEKMLTDQALMARTYLHAWQAFGEPRWLQVASETIEYVLRDLTTADGGWASAEDADSVAPDGVSREGAFQTWTPAEIRQVVGDADADAAITWWGVTDIGHLDGRSILHRPQRGALERPEAIERLRRALAAARARRARPGLDDKVLLEWNAMFLATLAEAALVTGNAAWLAAAVRNGELLAGAMRDDDGRWLRALGGRQRAFAADLAALVDAWIALAAAAGESRWIALAVDAADQLLDHHWDPDEGGVFTTASDGEQLIARQKDIADTATPSANSTAAGALLRLAVLTGETRFANHADRILMLLGDTAARHPGAFSQLLAAADLRRRGTVEIVVPGRDRPDLVGAAASAYMPNRVIAWGEAWDSPLWEGRSAGMAYVCHDHVCALPVTDPAALRAQLGL
jgi:uncharacterized protein